MFKTIWYEIKKAYMRIRYKNLKQLIGTSRPERRRMLKRTAKHILYTMPQRNKLTRKQSRGISHLKAKQVIAEQTRLAKVLWIDEFLGLKGKSRAC
jgi:hypothetical protein